AGCQIGKPAACKLLDELPGSKDARPALRRKALFLLPNRDIIGLGPSRICVAQPAAQLRESAQIRTEVAYVSPVRSGDSVGSANGCSDHPPHLSQHTHHARG